MSIGCDKSVTHATVGLCMLTTPLPAGQRQERRSHRPGGAVGGVMRMLAVLALAGACAGCATSETVQFRPTANQQGMTRDGNAALVSRGRSSIVLISPARRQFAAGGRPVFVVAMNNIGRQPMDFRVGSVQATQNINNQAASLQVITFEQLQAEEQQRQVMAAVLTGLAAGANAAAASRQGYYNRTSTVSTPRGTYQVQTTGYSPTANAIAQSNAAAQNEAMISATIERGQQNMVMLEREVIKDNTLLPGEWYGGQLHLQPLASDSSGGAKSYRISLLVGSDRHDIDIMQAATR